MSALAGIRIIELPGDSTAFAGKLLADMGADAIVVEPPTGAESRNVPNPVHTKRSPVASSIRTSSAAL